MTRICPLFSSSKGNSIYVGDCDGGILVDVGRSAKQIERALAENEIDIKKIRAIFLTHEHSDHIQGVKIFASRYNIKVFGSRGTLQALREKDILTGKFPVEIVSEQGLDVAGMFVESFRTPHDCKESVGYIVTMKNGKKVVVATDIGYISDTVKDAVSGADAVVIESNHDVRMLQNGAYPYYLKQRILSDKGHLSNEACANFLPFLVESGTTNFILAHLSQENNIVDLAFETSICSLKAHNMEYRVDFQLAVAPVANHGELNLVL